MAERSVLCVSLGLTVEAVKGVRCFYVKGRPFILRTMFFHFQLFVYRLPVKCG